jgi:hypothetical protein
VLPELAPRDCARPIRNLMQHFFFKLLPPRPSFAADMSADERALMDGHVGYWEPELGRAVLVFGPVFDPLGIFGCGITRFADDAAARAFAAGDPAIRADCGFHYEIHPMQAATAETAAAASS